ncbi:SusE domain-containing protein [Flavobacterium terrisoli]|uniref:SusE domain-containing protein n=1 Tax=Flavobacterium terrisoli TaxID=3242195 RepID=UPI002542E2FC|nr:SusE domain-containing protein [Flavobacterium buctense]
MKNHIKKINSILLLTLFFVLNSCGTDEYLKITSPDAEFKLIEPEINSVFLNFGLPNNPALTIVWKDDLTGSSNYIVEMSLDGDFTSVISLGSTGNKEYTISVDELNQAIRDAGVQNFRDISIFLRVNSGSVLSNSVLYFVTTYPTNPPVFTSPAGGSAYALSLSNADDTALTLNWSDIVLNSDLNIDVDYTVEAALAGTSFAAPVAIGSVSNGTTLAVTHADLNAVALGIGLAPGVAGNVDLRIKASNTNESMDVLVRTSSTLTISVTPYNVAFPNLYFVGDATTPGWNNNNNNTPVFRNQNTPNNYIYTGYFNAGAFKLLEVKGQWQPQWGTNDNSTLAVNPGGGSDPGTFNVPTAGYYTYSFTTVGQGGSFTVTPYTGSISTTYSTMGIIGAATANGWGSDTNMTQDPNNPHLWYITNVVLTANEMKFRANADWSTNWGSSGSTQPYGTGQFNSPSNISVQTAGTYDIWFNDLDGSYIFLLQ